MSEGGREKDTKGKWKSLLDASLGWSCKTLVFASKPPHFSRPSQSHPAPQDLPDLTSFPPFILTLSFTVSDIHLFYIYIYTIVSFPRVDCKLFLGEGWFHPSFSSPSPPPGCQLPLPSCVPRGWRGIPLACGNTWVLFSLSVHIHKQDWAEPSEKMYKTAGTSCHQLALSMHSVTEHPKSNYMWPRKWLFYSIL